MPVAGYSGTPLLKKLGITPATRLLVICPPGNYLALLEKDVSNQFCTKKSVPDMVHLFAGSNQVFEQEMKQLAPVWKANSALTIWVSWYKKSSGMATDLTEDTIRNYALANGLVDVKVCAVSEWWSALKLVVPLAKRKPVAGTAQKKKP